MGRARPGRRTGLCGRTSLFVFFSPLLFCLPRPASMFVACRDDTCLQGCDGDAVERRVCQQSEKKGNVKKNASDRPGSPIGCTRSCGKLVRCVSDESNSAKSAEARSASSARASSPLEPRSARPIRESVKTVLLCWSWPLSNNYRRGLHFFCYHCSGADC